MTDNEFMQQLADHMGDTTLTQKKRQRLLAYTHPTGTQLSAPYDAEFAHQQLKEQFGGDLEAMSAQLRDDLLNAGYASLGQLAKKNEDRKNLRALRGGAWGALAGLVGSAAVQSTPWGAKKLMRGMDAATYAASRIPLIGKTVPVQVLAAAAVPLLASAVFPTLGNRIGRAIGSYTHKPLTPEDLAATHTHPLLVAPTQVKAKTKLDLRER